MVYNCIVIIANKIDTGNIEAARKKAVELASQDKYLEKHVYCIEDA